MTTSGNNSLLNRFIRDKSGRIVVWQTPNLPLIGWFVFMVVARFADGNLRTGLQLGSTILLLVWAFLEIVKGVNYFRRLLGLFVFALTVMSHFR
jgi:hypothetical protein